MSSSQDRAALVGTLRGLSGGRRGSLPSTTQAAPGSGAAAATDERCEFCGAGLPADHRHLLELDQRRMICACETCWSTRSGEAAYRPAGVRVAWLDGFEMPDAAWASFGVPIGLAFFMRTTATTDGGSGSRVVAFYPSPAGATESEIDADAFSRLQDLNPALAGLEPDCEALVVDRISEPHRFVIAPIDECYKLVGMIKVSWEGISGGSGPARAIDRFFAELERRSPKGLGSAGPAVGADG